MCQAFQTLHFQYQYCEPLGSSLTLSKPGPARSLSTELSETKIYRTQVRARLGTITVPQGASQVTRRDQGQPTADERLRERECWRVRTLLEQANTLQLVMQCSTTPLEQKSARAHQNGEPEYTETAHNLGSPAIRRRHLPPYSVPSAVLNRSKPPARARLEKVLRVQGGYG